MHIDLESLREGYAELGNEILRFGKEVSPRGQKTHELLGASFTIHNPVDSLVTGTNRGVVKALAATESLQLIGGFHDPRKLVKAAPHFAKYLDEDGQQRAPYGPRLVDQLPLISKRLTEDPDSRQAQVVIWNPELDNAMGLHDYPCTTSMQWMIRDSCLDMQVHMRSNDFWLGVPYDVFQFTQLQLTLASVLGIEAGVYRHSAASLHIYEQHFDGVENLTPPTGDSSPTFGIAATSWDQAMTRAAIIHDLDSLPFNASPGERWLYLVMAALHD